MIFYYVSCFIWGLLVPFIYPDFKFAPAVLRSPHRGSAWETLAHRSHLTAGLSGTVNIVSIPTDPALAYLKPTLDYWMDVPQVT
jgi:hypothetical protein